eukprot:SAG31_NODE_1349_length_8691_cov_6.407239_5_plen_286_part_00
MQPERKILLRDAPSYSALPQRSTDPQPAPQEHDKPSIEHVVPARRQLRPAALAVLSSVNAPKHDEPAQQSISSRRRLRVGASAVLYAAGAWSTVNPTSELEAHLEFEEGAELGPVANLFEEHAAETFDAADAKVQLGALSLLLLPLMSHCMFTKMSGCFTETGMQAEAVAILDVRRKSKTTSFQQPVTPTASEQVSRTQSDSISPASTASGPLQSGQVSAVTRRELACLELDRNRRNTESVVATPTRGDFVVGDLLMRIRGHRPPSSDSGGDWSSSDDSGWSDDG